MNPAQAHTRVKSRLGKHQQKDASAETVELHATNPELVPRPQAACSAAKRQRVRLALCQTSSGVPGEGLRQGP